MILNLWGRAIKRSCIMHILKVEILEFLKYFFVKLSGLLLNEVS